MIELMIVIAIISVLAVIALPAYKDYTVRARLTGPMAALAETKTRVVEYVAANGRYPVRYESLGLNIRDLSAYSDVMWVVAASPYNLVEGDVIHLGAGIFKSVWEGGTKSKDAIAVIQLSGSTNADGSMSWECITGWFDSPGAEVPTRYMPANCRG